MTTTHAERPLDHGNGTAHERLHAGVSASIDVYANLSRSYAARGETRLAALALWVADVQVLISLLWESGLGSAPDPDAQLAEVADAVDMSLREHTGSLDGTTTVISALQNTRAALTAAFDESVHTLLNERFVSLAHLDGLPVPGPAAAERARTARLGDRSPQQLSDDLRVAAADCMAVFAAMARSGLNGDALEQAQLADLASFEAYLIEAAIAAGDNSLVTVDLRWDLATSTIRNIVEKPADLREAVNQFREILTRTVGPAEDGALRATFEPVGLMPA